MIPRNEKRSLCNAHGIRIYPVPVYGKYLLEIEFNKTADFDARHIRKNSEGKPKLFPGKERYDPNKKDWADKIDAMYDDLFEKKVKRKIQVKQTEIK